MSKWLVRSCAMIVLIILGVIFYHGWFNPTMPPVLTNERTTTIVKVETPPEAPLLPTVDERSKINSETISLTSLQEMESDHGAPPPVLGNAQGKSEQQSMVSESLILDNTEEKTTQKSLTTNTPAVTVTPVANTIKLESLATPESEKSVTVAKPVASSSVSSAKSAWIQAGSFGKADNAKRLTTTLQSKGLPTTVEAVTVNGAVYYRVYVGPVVENKVNDTLRTLSSMNINARKVTR